MTPLHRDRNLLRVRRATGVIAGASLAATGVFAGLAASKPKGTAKSTSARAARPQPTTTTTAPAVTPEQSQEEETQSQTQTQAPAIVVTPAQQAPVASSGGS